MFGYTDAPQAWALVSRMAGHAGADLRRAVVDGWLTRGELDAIVDCCASCAAKEDCRGWLARAPGRSPVPGFCPNRATLASLGEE